MLYLFRFIFPVSVNVSDFGDAIIYTPLLGNQDDRKWTHTLLNSNARAFTSLLLSTVHEAFAGIKPGYILVLPFFFNDKFINDINSAGKP